MKRGAARRRHFTVRSFGWIAVLAMLLGSVMPVGVLASNGPGAPDFLPNSGDQSNPGGATYAIQAERVITCTGDDNFTGMSGSIDITATAGGDPVPDGSFLIVYLTPNNGSDADPVDNVEDNQVKVDISGAVAGDTIPYNLVVTSAFTTSKGGVLGLIATPGSADDWTGGRTNCLGARPGASCWRGRSCS